MHFFGQNKSLDWFKWDCFLPVIPWRGELIKKYCLYFILFALFRVLSLFLSFLLSFCLSRLLSFRRFITVRSNCIHKHWMIYIKKKIVPLNTRWGMHSDTVALGKQHLHLNHLNIQMRLNATECD